MRKGRTDGNSYRKIRRARFYTSEKATFAFYTCVLSNGSFMIFVDLLLALT